MTKWAVVAEFEHHLPDGAEYEAYDWNGNCCQRCEERLVEYEREAPWSGVREPQDAPCYICAEYSDDGKTIEPVYAGRAGLRDHAYECHFSPPLRWVTERNR